MEPRRVVSVFGSAVIRVEPDLMSLEFGVSRQAIRPRDVLRETQQAAQIVRALLTKGGVTDVAASHINLTQTYEYTGSTRRATGYAARIGFNVVLSDLTKTEELLTGVVDAGANEIGAVEFRTSRWKELRMEARRRALEAARAKAEAYCRAAGLTLGPVVGIAEQAPDAFRANTEQAAREEPTDDSHPTSALAPNAIPVGAAVAVTFALE